MNCRTLATATLVVALVLLTAGVVSAKKPVKPPPTPADDGTIYFNLAGDLHGVAADGSGWTDLPDGVAGVPSAAPHSCATTGDDERWFIDLQPYGTEVYQNDVPRHELFAVSESGVVRRLTDAADIAPDHLGPTYGSAGTQFVNWIPYPQWVDGDTRVAYTAKRWVAGQTLAAEWGIYVLDVDPENLASHTPVRPVRIPVDVPLCTASDDDPTGGRVNVLHRWAPDGESFAYLSRLLGGGLGQGPLMRADHDVATDTWTTTELAEDTGLHCWAPMVDRLLVTQGGLATMDPYDPTDVTNLPITGSVKKNLTVEIWQACWSPSGTHIAYQVRTVTWKGSETHNVYVAATDGSGATNLTESSDVIAWLIGWGGD